MKNSQIFNLRTVLVMLGQDLGCLSGDVVVWGLLGKVIARNKSDNFLMPLYRGIL